MPLATALAGHAQGFAGLAVAAPLSTAGDAQAIKVMRARVYCSENSTIRHGFTLT